MLEAVSSPDKPLLDEPLHKLCWSVDEEALHLAVQLRPSALSCGHHLLGLGRYTEGGEGLAHGLSSHRLRQTRLNEVHQGGA